MSSPLSPKAQKAAEKEAKAAAKKAEKEAKEAAKKDKKEAKEKEKSGKKEEKDKDTPKKGKKGEEEVEVFDSSFERDLFPYQRIHYFVVPSQKESRAKVKQGSTWRDRWIVLYCNYLIYYEPSKVGQPTDSAKPLGAHKLEDCKPESITKFEKEIISGGLIPKMVNHDNCLTVLFGEKTLAFEFETEEEYKAWTSLLKKQATNVVKFKSKIAENDPRPLIEQLTNKYPSNHGFGNGPIVGEEARWIANVKDYRLAREEHLKTLRRAQLYCEVYNPSNKVWVDWFVTPGGEAKQSLEKDIMSADDTFVQGVWKKDINESPSIWAAKLDSEELTEEGEIEIEKILAYRLQEIDLYRQYQREVYDRDNELFETQFDNWTDLHARAKKMVETRAAKKKADEARAVQNRKDAWEKSEAERQAKEEELRNDPFSDMNKDDGDPFADVTIERI